MTPAWASAVLAWVVVLLLVLVAGQEGSSVEDLLNSASNGAFERVDAREGAFPYYVSLRRRILDLHYCAGTLISPQFILTSASCVDPEVFGSHVDGATADIGTSVQDANPIEEDARTSNDPELNATIAEFITHPNYSNGRNGNPPYDAQYDIALLRLKEKSGKCWAPPPIQMGSYGDGDVFVNAGLGRDEPGGPYQASLQMATFPFMSDDECSTQLEGSADEFVGGGKNMTAETSLCVRGDVGYCHLDEGSGLVQYTGSNSPPQLVGFANRATRECAFGDPYVFADVSFHLDWIFGRSEVENDILGGNWERSCGERRLNERIAGGAEAPRERYLYAVSVREMYKSHLCQGVLIAPKYVLTAGSCVSPTKFSNAEVLEAYIGGVHSNPDEDDTSRKEVKPVARVITHPNFGSGGSQEVNLALLELKEESSLPPIQLPTGQRDCCNDGAPMRVFGWGSASASAQFETRLQEGEVTFITRERCQRDHNVQDLNQVSVCAGGQSYGASLCDGDAGSPLIMTNSAQDILIGIGSPAPLAECRDAPAEFLKIAFFMSWIREHVPDV